MLLLTQTGAFPSTSGRCEEQGCRDAELYAYDYLLGGDAPVLLWRTIDFERDCDFDLYAGFMDGSVSVTDVDGDGLAEATFLYTLSCRSDVSPAVLKLIMHEGATKYAIRGRTDLSRALGVAGYGSGERRVDPALEAEPAMRDFALEQWERFVARDDFRQF